MEKAIAQVQLEIDPPSLAWAFLRWGVELQEIDHDEQVLLVERID